MIPVKEVQLHNNGITTFITDGKNGISNLEYKVLPDGITLTYDFIRPFDGKKFKGQTTSHKGAYNIKDHPLTIEQYIDNF